MTPMFGELLEKRNAISLLIDSHRKEKEAFSSQISKSSKEIAMLKELIVQVNKGSLDARCKWLWEKGSMIGFTYVPTAQDKDDILRINDKILEEENNRVNLAVAAKECKESIIKLEDELQYALIDVTIKTLKTSTDDAESSANYGSIIYIFEIDKHEYTENGNLTYSSHKIKYVPQDEFVDAKSYEWREVRPSKSDKSKETDALIQQIPKWNYIINNYLKKRVHDIDSKS